MVVGKHGAPSFLGRLVHHRDTGNGLGVRSHSAEQTSSTNAVALREFEKSLPILSAGERLKSHFTAPPPNLLVLSPLYPYGMKLDVTLLQSHCESKGSHFNQVSNIVPMPYFGCFICSATTYRHPLMRIGGGRRMVSVVSESRTSLGNGRRSK